MNEGGPSLLSVKDFVDRAKVIEDLKDLESLRKDSIETENFYRELFARKRENWEVPELDDNFHYLIDVFSNGASERSSTEVFKCFPKFNEDDVPRVFPLKTRLEAGELGIVPCLQEFHQSWNLLTEDCLRFLDWTNVLAAGGAVAGCLAPLPERILNVKGFGPQRTARRKYFHDEYLPGSDIDLFLYGIDEQQAKEKLLEIYDAVQAASPFPVRAFRSTHAITLVSQYPFRHVQIILRIYNSASEVLCGFDVDSCAVGYNGSKVVVPPRTAMAIMTQSNTVDMSRRSPSYETRLAKYANRGFEILIPSLERNRVDPYLYEKRFDQAKGLSRLLLLEKLRTPEERLRYRIETQMKSSGHSNWRLKHRLRQLQNDRWNMNRQEGTEGMQQHSTVEASDYSTIFLPWGPDWTASRIERQMRKKDKFLNQVPFKRNGEVTSSERAYKIHVCAIGTMEEVISDPFPNDPPLPKNIPSDKLHSMVYGEVSWLVDNPGRQQIGSFHPITDEVWSDGAYFTIAAENLTKAAVANDSVKIESLFREKEGESDQSQKNFLVLKDFLGRTSLHLAALAGSDEACEKLLNHPFVDGDYLKARLPDGRTALHVAAMKGNVVIAKLILEKRKSIAESAVDSLDQVDYNALFDVLDIDGADLENKLNPLQYAVSLGQVEIVRLLIKYDADVRKVAVHKDVQRSYSCLSLLTFYASECGKTGISNVKAIVDLLLDAGASFTQMDKLNGGSITCWHYLAMISDELEWNALPIFLEAAKKHVSDINMIALNTLDCRSFTPLYIATLLGNFTSVELLLSYGASPNPSDELWSRMLKNSRHTLSPSPMQLWEAMRKYPFFLAVSLLDVKTLQSYCKVKKDLVNISITIEDDSIDHRRSNFNRLNVTTNVRTKTIRALDLLEEILRKEKNPSKEPEQRDSYWRERYDNAKATLAQVEKKVEKVNADGHQSLENMWWYLMLEREKMNFKSRMRGDPQSARDKRKLIEEDRSSDKERKFTKEDRLAQLQSTIAFIQGIGGDYEPIAVKDEKKMGDSTDHAEVKEAILPPLPDPMVNFVSISLKGFETTYRHNYYQFRHTNFSSYGYDQSISCATTIDRTAQLFHSVYTGQVSELKSAVAITSVYVENAVGKTTALFLAVMRGDVEAFKVISNEASAQYQRHVHEKIAVNAKTKQREEGMNKRLKNTVDNKNTVQKLVNRVNNLDPATGDLPTTTSGPDSIRFELETFEEKPVDYDSNKDAAISSSLPPEALLLHRSLFVLDDDVLKFKQSLQEFFSVDLKEKKLFSFRPIELAIIKGDVEMVKEIITFARTAGAPPSSKERDVEILNHEDDDSTQNGDDNYSECTKDFECSDTTRKTMTQARLRFSMVGPGSANASGLSALEMAAMMDNVEIFNCIASYAKEFVLPLKLVALWKSQVNPVEIFGGTSNQHKGSLPQSPQPDHYSPLHLILRYGSKNLIGAVIAQELDGCLIDWLFKEPYKVPATSKIDHTSLTPFYETTHWLSRQIFERKISKEEVAERICRVVTVDLFMRNPLFYVPTEFVPTIAAEGAKYLALRDSSSNFAEYKSKFVNSATPNGVTALLAAVSRGEEDRVQVLINEGANRCILISDVKKWGVLHFVVVKNDKFSKFRAMTEILLKGASDSEIDEMVLSPSSEHTPFMLAVSLSRNEEITMLLYEKTLHRSVDSFARCDSGMNSVLHLAAKGNRKHDVELLRHLLLHSSVTPGRENARGYTAAEISLEAVLSIWSKDRTQMQHRFCLVPPRSNAKEYNKLLEEKTNRRNAFNLLESSTSVRYAVGFSDVKAKTNDAAQSARELSEQPRGTMGRFVLLREAAGKPHEPFIKTTSDEDCALPSLSFRWVNS